MVIPPNPDKLTDTERRQALEYVNMIKEKIYMMSSREELAQMEASQSDI